MAAGRRMGGHAGLLRSPRGTEGAARTIVMIGDDTGGRRRLGRSQGPQTRGGRSGRVGTKR
ncbi:hypothetical protein D779_0470 [Imhoffiella purpurea]|uniref:Uncharacterized protein n=1 Tax=Imhoffiella purpurea TaxID=1249627 RepID=W9W0M3_9GAMM|nr:hypothetical protein D779_0470 [Imhoffiella purpurea]